MRRKLAAILAADVVGYSALMAEDEAATMAALNSHRRELFEPMTAQRGGRIVKLMGDGVLVEFPSVVEAVECAIAVQSAMAEQPGAIRLRIGVNLGDVITEGDDIYGDGVNIAARLEALADTGGICISSTVKESIGKRAADFVDAGERTVKGAPRPIRVWQWSAEPHVADTTWAAEVKWNGGFRSEAKIRDFNGTPSDEPEQLGGTNTGPNPVEQVLGALGNCLAVGYAANATAAGITISNMTIKVEGDLDLHTFLGLKDGNAGFKDIKVNVHLDSDASAEDLRALHDKVTATSPVGHTLGRAVPVAVRLA